MSQKLGIWKILTQCWLYRPYTDVYNNIGYPTVFLGCSGKICYVFQTFCIIDDFVKHCVMGPSAG